jgi:hypothetical protein
MRVNATTLTRPLCLWAGHPLLAPVAAEVLAGAESVRFDVKPVTDSFCQFSKLGTPSRQSLDLWSGSTLC